MQDRGAEGRGAERDGDSTEPSGAATVEPARPGDAAGVARLHASAIQEGFLSSLGPRFLQHLYAAMAGSRHVVLLVAREDGALGGFVSGALAPGAFYREFLRRHTSRAAVLLAVRAIRPSVARRILETLRQLRRSGRSAGASQPELLSIAVDPAHRRAGVGSLLVAALDAELRARGADHVVVVVAARNTAARALYERQGFGAPEPVEVHRGVPSVRYRKPLEIRPQGQ